MTYMCLIVVAITNLWGTGLERLHGPTQELKLTLGELGGSVGNSGLLVVRHVVDVGVGWRG